VVPDVVERDRRPFVGRSRPNGAGVAFAEKGFVFDPAEGVAAGSVVDFDQRQRPAECCERRLDDRREFAVGDQQFGLAVREDEGDRARVEPGIQRIQHSTGHRHAEMRLE